MTLNRNWFDLIAEGVKKEEYRDPTDYWISRLLIKGTDTPKPFDQILFVNGYNPKSPMMWMEYLGLDAGFGNPEWGGGEEEVFILRLGKVIKTENYHGRKKSHRLDEQRLVHQKGKKGGQGFSWC
jgi:hypothetical protein